MPQLRLSLDDLGERATIAEEAGFEGFSMMDHLAPPFAPDQPMYEAFMTTMWLASRTESLRFGQLVLCDAMRHPAVLAKQVVTLDHASQGRFDLGLGWGSVPEELTRFGLGSPNAQFRIGRLHETLEVLTGLWEGRPFTYTGEYFVLEEAQQLPDPEERNSDHNRWLGQTNP